MYVCSDIFMIYVAHDRAHTHVHGHTHGHVPWSKGTATSIHQRVHVTYTHAYTMFPRRSDKYACTRTCVYIYKYTHMHVGIYVCIFTCTR